MSITAIGGAPYTATTSIVTLFTVPMPAGVQVGDLLLMQVASSVTANPTVPTGWAIFEPNLGIGNPGPTHITYFRWADSTDLSATGVDVTGPSGKYEAHIVAFRGVDPTTPKDVDTPAGTRSATSTMAIPPPITTVTPGALVVLLAGANSPGAVTTATWSSANMTVVTQGTATIASQTNPMAAVCIAPMASPGTFAPDVSVTPGTGRTSMNTVALRPAPTVPSTGSGSGSWNFVGAASGRPTSTTPSTGSGSGSWSFSGSATGGPNREVSAWSSGVTATTLASTPGTGSGTGSWVFSGVAIGRASTVRATGSWSFTGAAFGRPTTGRVTYHRALRALFIGVGAGFVRAFSPGDDVPESVLTSLALGTNDVSTYTA